MSEWTSLNEIMRDLSVAQGRKVPVSLEAISHKKPPPLVIEEETEEEYYKSCGDVDFSKPPDFNLIQQMLSMVTNNGETEDNSILNSNLNPLSPEFVPQMPSSPSNTRKKKNKKNVAIQSILETQAKEISANQPEVSKPISSNMFRRRTTPTKDKKPASVTEKSDKTRSRYTKACQYTPSMLASQYYNKYLNNAKLKEQTQEDIWTRAEREMKKIDELKKRKRGNSSSSSQDLDEDISLDSSNTSFSSGLDFVSLLHHRHIPLNSPEDCVVCNVAAKHGYSFKEELSEASPFA